MTILIVTSRPASFSSFTPVLTEEGGGVFFASGGQAALDRVRTEPPDLVVVDEDLPDMSPFALVARLIQVNASIATAVVSGLSTEAFHEAGEGLGILMELPPRLASGDARALLQTLRRTA